MNRLTVRFFHYCITPLILIIATCIAYMPSLHYDFQFDDIFNIKKLFALRSGEIYHWFLNGPRWMSYMLNTFHYMLADYDPYVYRRSNLIIHSLNGFFVFLITSFLLKKSDNNFFKNNSFLISSLTSLFFLLHPVQTQTVSYVIQGQLEGLAFLFINLVILFYIAYASSHSFVCKILLNLIVLFFGFLSTGSKEIAIISPLLLLLIDWFFIAKASLHSLLKRILFLTTYAFFIFFQYAYYLDLLFIKHSFLGKAKLLNNIGNMLTSSGSFIHSYDFFISQFKVIIHYIFIFIWPFSMSVDYDWKISSSFFSFESFCPFLILFFLAFFLMFIFIKDNKNIIVFASLWFFISLAPRSSFIPSTELVADYKTYIPSYGIFLLYAYGLALLFLTITKKSKKNYVCFYGILSFLSLASLLGFTTYRRNLVWSSGESFWLDVIKHAPTKARAYNNYGVALAEKTFFKEAIPYFKKAIKLDKFYPDPWSNISVCYASTNQADLAIDSLKEAIKINPYYPEFFNNLSSYLLARGDIEESKKNAELAIRLRPHYGKAYFNLGQAFYAQGDKKTALNHIKYACMSADYDVLEAFRVYGSIAIELKDYQEVILAYNQVLKRNPQDIEALLNKANALFCSYDFDQAERLYEFLLQIKPEEDRAWASLADILCHKKDYQKALWYYKKSLNKFFNNQALQEKIIFCEKMLLH